MTKLRAWAIDAAERIGATFVEAAAGAIPAALAIAGPMNWETTKAIGFGAGIAGLSAVAALAKTSAAAFLKKGSSTPAGLVDVPNPLGHPAAGPGVVKIAPSPSTSSIVQVAKDLGMTSSTSDTTETKP